MLRERSLSLIPCLFLKILQTGLRSHLSRVNFLFIENNLPNSIFNLRRFAMSDRLSVERIKQIIREEKSKIEKGSLISSDAVENAWSGGDNLVNKVDYIKQLGIKEAKLRKKADIYKGLRERLEKSMKRGK